MRSRLQLSAACILLCTALSAAAQHYPSKPVRVIVPYPPGGITDIVSRAVAQELARSLNQSFVIDNRPGANSILGAELVARANPDGYTLGTVIAAHAANQTLYPKLPFDSIKSFEQVSLLGTAPLAGVALVADLPGLHRIAEALELQAQRRAGDGAAERPIRLLHARIGDRAHHLQFRRAVIACPALGSFQKPPAGAAMIRIDDRLLQAAASLGAPPRTIFWKVFFPLTLPALAAGALLVFILCLGFYVTPAVLGGGRVPMISNLLDTLINQIPRWEQASAISTILLIVTLVIFAAYRRLDRRASA